MWAPDEADRALGHQAPGPPGSWSSRTTFQKCEQLCQAQLSRGCCQDVRALAAPLVFSSLTFGHPRASAPGQPSAHGWSGAAVAVVVSVVFLTAAPPRGPRQNGLVENTGKDGA